MIIQEKRPFHGTFLVSKGEPLHGRSGIIGFEKAQEYQWFVGNRQVEF